jgi:hypothetical protein
MKHLKLFEEWNILKKQPYNDINIPQKDLIDLSKVLPPKNIKVPADIQEEYDNLMLRLMDGSADPDPFYVEDRVEQLRKQYPCIRSSWDDSNGGFPYVEY